MNSIIIRCPSFLSQQNNNTIQMNKDIYSFQNFQCDIKEEHSTTSTQSASYKFTNINEFSSSSQIQCKQDKTQNDYTHYVKMFQKTNTSNKVKQVSYSCIPAKKMIKSSHMSYQNLVESLNEANIQKLDDNFLQQWIDFMENYSCEDIGLNLSFKKSLNQKVKETRPTKNENESLQFNINNNACNLISVASNKKMSSTNTQNTNQIEINDIIPSFQIPQFVEELIFDKFCLYIQSQYKILKSNDFKKQQAAIDQNIYNLIYNNNSSPINNNFQLSNDCSNSTPINNSNNSSFSTLNQSKKIMIDMDSSEQGKSQKKYHFNMSKYFMLFLLELFRNQHLNALHNLPETIISEITTIVNLIQNISKKNNQSKTNYYNHFHYDVLFLQINEKTKSHILKNSKLNEMHQKIFRVQNLNCSFTIERINIIKHYFTQIVLSQLSILKKKLTTSIKGSSLPKDEIEDINSKIDYLYRVEQGISDLNNGKAINRF